MKINKLKIKKMKINELRLDFVELQTHPEKYDIVIIGVTKKCSQCDNIKLLSEFTKYKASKDGHKPHCRVCQNKTGKEYYNNNKEQIIEKQKKYYKNNKEQKIEYQKEYSKNNKEQLKEHQKEYYKNNKEKISEQKKEYYKNNKEQITEQRKIYRENNKEYQKEYYENNKEQINGQRKKYEKNRKDTDPLYKLTKNIRGRISGALKEIGYTKKSRTAEILGCSFEELQEHIGKQMSRWMNYENHGLYNGEFNFGWDIDHIIPLASAKTEEERLKLCHYTNLQPLCSKVNRDIKRDKLNFNINEIY